MNANVMPKLFFFLALFLVPSLAFGQTAEDAEARAIFDAGVIAYDAGRYENALASFERAYELSHRPELLYNIGLAAEHLRRDERAIAAYERYLAELPNGVHHEPVAARLAVLRRAVEEREATEARLREAEAARQRDAATTSAQAETSSVATPTSTPRDERATSPARIALVSIGAALVVGAGIGVGLWTHAGSQLDRCRNADPSSALCLNEDQLVRQRTGAIATTIGAGVAGVALVVTGILLRRHPDRAVACAPVGTALGCAGRF